jgi:hypothetical protein
VPVLAAGTDSESCGNAEQVIGDQRQRFVGVAHPSEPDGAGQPAFVPGVEAQPWDEDDGSASNHVPGRP